jgi:hypothetical protein
MRTNSSEVLRPRRQKTGVLVLLSCFSGKFKVGKIKNKAVIPNGGITARLCFPLPFVGIIQTGSRGLPAFSTWQGLSA